MLALRIVVTLSVIWITLAQNRKLTPSQYKFMQMGFQDRYDLFGMPQLVRMAYHDCVGGCDGCVDMTNPSNAGLQATWDWTLDFKNDFAPQLSMADTIAFLGIEALKLGAEQSNNTINIDFWVGRKDCDSSKGMPKRTFIQHHEMDGMKRLGEMFGLTPEECVALMGCHSLGGMQRENSGFTMPITFRGRIPWDRTPLGLDNQYYGEMLSGDWVPKPMSNEIVNSTFWTKGPVEQLMMLNADMALFKNFTVSGEMDTPSCTEINFTSCPVQSNDFDHVLAFARDEDVFLQTLSTAFGKMINGNKAGMFSIVTAPDFSG